MTMGRFEQAKLRVYLRHDLATFIHRTVQTVAPGGAFQPNWHIEVIARYLEQCVSGEIKRLLISLPPRNLKSIAASVAYPAWLLGRDPSLRVICASYSQDLAAKHARDCRAVLESDWYRATFRQTRLDPKKTAEAEVATTAGGFRLTTSIGGTLTGRGGNVLIVDDALKADDAYSEAKRKAVVDWFTNTLYSRLDDKADGVIVVVMQRLHEDDLIGHLLRSGEDWAHLSLPAIAVAPERFDLGDGRVVGREIGEALHPEREPPEVLQLIKAGIGSAAFAAHYQQDPLPPEGHMIDWAWFRSYDAIPEREANDIIVQSWDTATKAGELNDFSVCTTWLQRGATSYLLDLFRDRLEYPELKRKVVAIAERYRADSVLIEDSGTGSALIQELKAGGAIRPIAITPEGDKVTRMSAQSAKIEAGNVLLPKQAPWLDDFRAEVLQFPHGRHDDQIDSLSQYLGWRRKRVRITKDDFMVVRSPFLEACEAEFGSIKRYFDRP